MIDKKQIITDFDRIIGNNQEVTDDTHMNLVHECADYTETLVNKLLGIADVVRQSEQLNLCKHTMCRNPKENQENKCRLCGKPYKKV